MDWLSKRKFVIVCHEKVVRIPLEGNEILQVYSERTQGVVKTLNEHKAMSVAKSPYRLAPLEMQELSEQLRELQDKVLEVPRKEKLYAKSSVKDKILATLSETSKVENAPAEMLYDLDQQMEKRANDGCKTNVVIDALRRKEQVKPRRVRAMDMTIRYGVRGMMLAAQSEAFKQENGMMRTVVMDEAHASRSHVLWVEIGESSLTGLELVQETTDKVVLIKEKLKAARDRPKELCWIGLVADSLHVPLDEIKVDKTLRFVEEPIENSDREVKRLKCSRIVVVKLHLGSKRGKVVSSKISCEDYLKDKYPRLNVW
ncbi:hypothetical protein Tco_0572250 [Tanacetum coccineum]